jgi:serine/threonine protein phosphatase PrpC
MAYSLAYKEYYIEIWLAPLTEFTIYFKGSSILLPDYPTKIKKSGEATNYIEDNIAHQANIDKLYYNPQKFTQKNLYFSNCSKTIGKVLENNEDAHFLTASTIGIADGIGSQLKNFGISSKDFSIELMQKCQEIVDEGKTGLKCKDIVKKALMLMKNGGSSTYLLASIIGNKIMISNMGDCGLLIFRKKLNKFNLLFRSSPKLYNFNTPYQVYKQFSPKQLIDRSPFQKKIINSKSDLINSDEYCLTVHKNDIIISGTDGFFDNVSIEEVSKIIKKCTSKVNLQDITNKLFELAYRKSNGTETTPFQLKMNEIDRFWVGGKRDDITVIVTAIKSKDSL